MYMYCTCTCTVHVHELGHALSYMYPTMHNMYMYVYIVCVWRVPVLDLNKLWKMDCIYDQAAWLHVHCFKGQYIIVGKTVFVLVHCMLYIVWIILYICTMSIEQPTYSTCMKVSAQCTVEVMKKTSLEKNNLKQNERSQQLYTVVNVFSEMRELQINRVICTWQLAPLSCSSHQVTHVHVHVCKLLERKIRFTGNISWKKWCGSDKNQ